jgi:hypothetical protein
MIKQYFNRIRETLLFFDFQPLLFFWLISDVLNNQILWTTLSYWTSVDQPFTYWLYMCYFVCSLMMLISINNIKWLARFVSMHLMLILFATIRYMVDICMTIESEPFALVDGKNLLITCWYAFMWSWILFKLKREILINTVRYGQ